MTAEDVGALLSQQDSIGCLLAIAGYDDIAAALRLVTEQAISRINVSPELGDFFEVRFVGLGSRPAPDAGGGEAVDRVAAALTRPTGSAARHYFALIVADRSAGLVARMLGECGEHPVLSRLQIRCRGLASVEDRPPGSDQPELAGENGIDGIFLAPTGAWRQAGLVHEVQQFARELLQDIASGTEAGLTSAQLSQMRPDAGDGTSTAESATSQLPLDELTPAPAERLARHALPAVPAASTDTAPPRRELAPLVSPLPPSPARRPLPGMRLGAGRVHNLWRSAPRAARLTDHREQARDGDRQLRPPALLFLALVGDEGMQDLGNWRRGRSVLLEIDKLAMADPAGFRIRALRRAGDAGMTEPQEPGQLSRHDIGRPAAILDFPRVLSLVRTAVKRQVTASQTGTEAAPRAAVVFFAAAAPLADAVTTAIYRQLVGEADVNWIVPERLADLLSPRFTEGGARKIDDHPAVAEEVIGHLSSGEIRQEDK